MDGSTLSHDQCISIANQWVDIFAANELLRVEGKVEIALVVFDETRRWCLQYLPAGMFEKILSSSKYMTERYIGKGHTIIVGGSVRKFTNTSLRTPSKKTLYEGKVVDKTPDIPEPQLWKPHPYKPKKAVTPTAMGKVRGRPPKTGSVADNVRKGIVTLMSGSGGSGGESSGSTSSVSSFNGQPEPEPNDGTNELVMNLGSV
jgi:hypothetical protein